MATAFRSAQMLLRRQVLSAAPKQTVMRFQPATQSRGFSRASRVLREEESASRKHQAQTTGTRLARLKNGTRDLEDADVLTRACLRSPSVCIGSAVQSCGSDPKERKDTH